MMRHLWLGLAALLAGCEVGPDYHAPAIATGAAPAPALASGSEPAYDALAPLPANWWRLYDDPVLDGLVKKALGRNTDLRQSLASLEQMRATLRETELQETPQTSLSASATGGYSKIQSAGMTMTQFPALLYDASESISYDLDLFGHLKRETEESQANVGEAQAMLDLMRVTVAAQTASAYAQACSAGLSIAVTNRSIALTRRMLDLTQRRVAAGVTADSDIIQSRSTISQTEAKLPALLAQQRTALFMLATLTGDPPSAVPAAVADCATPPRLHRKIPIGDGAALIARRPDVRSAERKLAAAVADIGVNTSQLYPSVTLSGSVEAVKTNITGMSTKLFSASIGPMVSWNFPNLSVARARVEESEASARSALASFDGYVLTALREAESALVTLARDLDTERLDSAARDYDALAYDAKARLYAGGIGQFSSVLDAENTLIQAESSLADATTQVSKDQVSLFKALGGGWQDAPEIVEASLDQVAPERH